LEEFQRRGAHVSVPKLGSRGGKLCFGGILGSYADLRRDLKGGNFNLLFFEGLGWVPRRFIEEGGRFVQLVCTFGGILVNWMRFGGMCRLCLCVRGLLYVWVS
jgi:hypothetical protein